MDNEPETPAVDDGFEWAIVEIFGHRRHAGRTREEERFGAKMLRIDIPEIQVNAEAGAPDHTVLGWTTHYYGGSSIFSCTLTDEASVMRINRPYTPASRYIAPPDRDRIDDIDGDEELPW